MSQSCRLAKYQCRVIHPFSKFYIDVSIACKTVTTYTFMWHNQNIFRSDFDVTLPWLTMIRLIFSWPKTPALICISTFKTCYPNLIPKYVWNIFLSYHSIYHNTCTFLLHLHKYINHYIMFLKRNQWIFVR